MSPHAALDELYPPFTWLRKARPREARGAEELWRRFRVFSDSVAAPAALELDDVERAHEHVFEELLTAACRHRLFSATIPIVYGGLGLPLSGLLPGLEELARGCAGIANLLSVHGLGLAVVGATGNLRVLGELCRSLVSSEARGAPELVATALTEPSAGTDAESIELLGIAKVASEARPTQDGFLLNGRKVFISNGNLAEHIIVLMPTDRRAPASTLHAFLVRRGSAGFEVENVEAKMGQRACPAATLSFSDCFVPNEACVGAVGGRELDLVLGSTRGAVAAYGAGIARAALELCLAHAKTLSDGRGTPLIDCQWAKLLLAEQQSAVWQARGAYWTASVANERFGAASLVAGSPTDVQHWLPRFLVDSGPSRQLMESTAAHAATRLAMANLPEWKVALAAAWGAGAKVSASDAAVRSCELGMELLGAIGSRREVGLEKLLRDAKLLQIYEGTNELNRLEVFAKSTGYPLLSSPPEAAAAAGPSLDVSMACVPARLEEDTTEVLRTVERWLSERALATMPEPEKGSDRPIEDALLTELMDLGVADLGRPEGDGGGALDLPLAGNVLRACGRRLPSLGVTLLAHFCASALHPYGRVAAEPEGWLGFPLFDELWNPVYSLSADPAGHLFSGRIPLVVGASTAKHLVLPARYADGGARGWCRVARNAEGVRIGEAARLHGLSGAGACDVELNQVSGAWLFGSPEGRTPSWRDGTFDATRPWALSAALCLGILEASAALSSEYANVRVQGGQTLLEHDAVMDMLAQLASDMATASSALNSLLTSAELATELALVLTVRAATLRGTELGIRILGGYGYLSPYQQERRHREARQACMLCGRSPLLRQRLRDVLRGLT